MSRVTHILTSLNELSEGLLKMPGLMYVMLLVLAVLAFIMYRLTPRLKMGYETKIRIRRMAAILLIAVYMLFLLMLKLFVFPDAASTEAMLVFGVAAFILYFFLGRLFAWYEKKQKKAEVLQPLIITLLFVTVTEAVKVLIRKSAFQLSFVGFALLGLLLGCLFTKAWRYGGKKRRKRANRIAVRIFLSIAYVLLICVVGVFGAYHVLRTNGEASMQKNISSAEPDLPKAEEEEGNYIRRNGKLYQYNDALTTILFMGVDQHSDEIQAVEHVSNESTQADSIFLFVMNDLDQSCKLIGISRDTMTEIKTYDYNGEYVGDAVNHLTLAYTFGDGKEKSCLNMVDAVSRLFHGMPIHSYVALNMAAIKDINDTVGGVEVNVLEDMTSVDSRLWVGNQVLLKGNTALEYVQWRDSREDFSNNKRMERQKQYLMNFMRKAVSVVSTDLSLPSRLYQHLTGEMVTNISLDDAVYLSSKMLSMNFSDDSIRQVEGESVRGEKYDEFYVNEDALYDLILDVFYIEKTSGGAQE